MVVNKNGTIEQFTHYYPYGELMADISTNPTKQEFKYGGKELDRTFGLDLYDYHARLQDSKLGRFTSIDPLAEKYYWISPYVYCAGDPVNLVDPDGKDLVDVLAGFGIGIRTNMPLGNGEDRDAYSPTDTDDYNKGLRIADAVSFAAGVTSMIAGAIETIGGALGTTVGAAAEVPSAGASTLVVVGSATVSADGVAKMGAGVTVTMNAVSNGQQGYNRGTDPTDKQLKDAQKSINKQNGGAPDEIGRLDAPNPKQPKSQWHVHPSNGKRGGTNFDGSPHDGGHEWGRRQKNS